MYLPAKLTQYIGGEVFSITDFEYDNKGNLIRRFTPYIDDEYEPIESTYASTDYDEYGNLLTSDSEDATLKYSYSGGHTTKGESKTDEISFEYHDNGLRKTVIHARIPAITKYYYDENGYLTKIDVKGSELAGTYNYQWEQDDEGAPLSCTYDDYYGYINDTITASVVGNDESPAVETQAKVFLTDENGCPICVYASDGTIEQEIEYVQIESPNEHAWEVANTYGYEKLDGLYPIRP